MLDHVSVLGYVIYSYTFCAGAGMALALFCFVKYERSIGPSERGEIAAYAGIAAVSGWLFAALGDAAAHGRLNGFSVVWGTAGGVLVFAALRRRASYWPDVISSMNALAPYLAIAQAVGRIGCFLGGCCFGRPSEFPISVRYPEGSAPHEAYGGAALLPSPLIEALLLAVIAALIFAADGIRRRAALFYAAAYPLARFAAEFTRGDDRGSGAFGMSPTQLFCAAVLICQAALYARNMIKCRRFGQ